MPTEQAQHRRFVVFLDLPADISEDAAAEVVGCVDNDLADAYPEELSGGSYFHNLKLASLVTTGSASAPAGTCRYRVHLDLFEGADVVPDFLDQVVDEANGALPKHVPAANASSSRGFHVADRNSVLVHDPTCFYCNERDDDQA